MFPTVSNTLQEGNLDLRQHLLSTIILESFPLLLSYIHETPLKECACTHTILDSATAKSQDFEHFLILQFCDPLITQVKLQKLTF